MLFVLFPLLLLRLNNMIILHSCFGCRVSEGYGMTETSCVISGMDEGDNLSGHVGSPNPACGELLSYIILCSDLLVSPIGFAIKLIPYTM